MMDEYRKLFEELRNEVYFGRLGKTFKTNDSYYFLDIGTGKVAKIEEKEMGLNFKKHTDLKRIGVVLLLLTAFLVGCSNDDNEGTNEGNNSEAVVNTDQGTDSSSTSDNNLANETPDLNLDDLEEIIGSVADLSMNEMRIIEGMMNAGGTDEGDIFAMRMDTPEEDWLTVFFDESTIIEISEIIDGDLNNLQVSTGTINDLREQENVQVFGERDGDGFHARKIVIGRHTFTRD